LQKLVRTLTHSKIEAYFSKNSEDFAVREVPLYEFSNQGEHLIISISKKDLTTQEALRLLSTQTGVKMRDFGFAGLKDKQGYTSQFISMPKKFEKELANFSNEKLKINATFTHSNKLKIGHLRGNSFFIRLKKVSPLSAIKLSEALQKLDKQGFANYFGYQRFGKFKDNFKSALEILKGKRLKNPKMNEFLLSAFQSELFNEILAKRVKLCHLSKSFNAKELSELYQISNESAREIKAQKGFFKLLKGEVLMHYPYGKCFIFEDLNEELGRFEERKITSALPLFGQKLFEAQLNSLQKHFEDESFKPFLEFKAKFTGSRRFAWSFLENLKFNYDEKKAHFCMEFFLQKGSYATVILEELLGENALDEN